MLLPYLMLALTDPCIYCWLTKLTEQVPWLLYMHKKLLRKGQNTQVDIYFILQCDLSFE